MDMTQVGWLVWNIADPKDRHFSALALTEADMRAGYRAKPVYTLNNDIVHGDA